jgi:hypothetical protein
MRYAVQRRPAESKGTVRTVVAAKEAAEAARVHEKTIRSWAREGRIVAFRLAGPRGPWRIPLDDHGLPITAPTPARALNGNGAALRFERPTCH